MSYEHMLTVQEALVLVLVLEPVMDLSVTTSQVVDGNKINEP